MQMRRWIVAVMCGATVVSSSAQAQRAVATADHAMPSNEWVHAVLVRPVTLTLNGVSLKRAINALAAAGGVRIAYEGTLLDAIATPVTVRAKRLPFGDVLDSILSGTGLQAVPVVAGQLSIEPVVDGNTVRQGIMSGQVVDATTKHPIVGAVVILDGAARGVQTDRDGMFRISGISVGKHTVMVRRVGYVKAVRSLTVDEGAVATVNVSLEVSANTLDQVVVTGTVIPTERKAVPNAMIVVTAKEIEQRGITHIDQLFRGDVPGVFALNTGSRSPLDQVTMYARGATAIQGNARTNYTTTNPIKTYVDGIEMADPQYLSQIDPRSIERIEILTGPQASTIYGSNAINGVMQIFTKRGTTSTPQLTLNLTSGLIQNDFSPALTPEHDYSGTLTGNEGRLSYSAGGSWDYLGAWTPAKRTVRQSIYGGARLSLPTSVGAVTADMTLRRSVTENKKDGDQSQARIDFMRTGAYTINPWDAAVGRQPPETNVATGQALGLTIGYAPANWWSHELTVGQDALDGGRRITESGLIYPADSALWLDQSHLDKRSVRYSTTARIPLAHVAQATVTLGADTWQSVTTWFGLAPQRLTGDLGQGSATRQPEHNTGSFLQAQVGFFDKLFLAYGLRAEWNPDFGAEAQPNYAPRYGAAYTTDIAGVTAKARVSYGRATRPPTQYQKLAVPVALDNGLRQVYGAFNEVIANPELGPEFQQGWEGGVELYLGSRASLVVTHYNQTVDGLIARVPGADSVRSLVANPMLFGTWSCEEVLAFHIPAWCSSQDASGHTYAWLDQNINAASVRNQGWELQGTLTTGPLVTRGTYSWTKSRSIGITDKFRERFLSLIPSFPEYARGASFMWVPEHTWALGMTYVQAQTTVALTVSGVGQIYRSSAWTETHLSSDVRLQQERWNVNVPQSFRTAAPGYATANLTASRRVSPRVEALFDVQNLTDWYANDASARDASIGRQTKAGIRVRW